MKTEAQIEEMARDIHSKYVVYYPSGRYAAELSISEIKELIQKIQTELLESASEGFEEYCHKEQIDDETHQFDMDEAKHLWQASRLGMMKATERINSSLLIEFKSSAQLKADNENFQNEIKHLKESNLKRILEHDETKKRMFNENQTLREIVELLKKANAFYARSSTWKKDYDLSDEMNYYVSIISKDWYEGNVGTKLGGLLARSTQKQVEDLEKKLNRQS